MKSLGLDRSCRRIRKLLNEHLQNALMNEHARTERGLLLHSTSPEAAPLLQFRVLCKPWEE